MQVSEEMMSQLPQLPAMQLALHNASKTVHPATSINSSEIVILRPHRRRAAYFPANHSRFPSKPVVTTVCFPLPPYALQNTPLKRISLHGCCGSATITSMILTAFMETLKNKQTKNAHNILATKLRQCLRHISWSLKTL